ncbi:hypothetical protein NQ315_015882 [Exocentrus adspersus]|uniref:Uncharacterized protein n=1 Tax=Exocentrus adspersus TaxID=1586481 RepID=A0AAV8W3D7_9CUCU|nr:hypothetical protein NQ315_015882 [Exocentrus adspersus]
MRFSWLLLPLMLSWLYSTRALCPTSCACKQSESGQRKVSCSKGGMQDPIPTSEMDLGVEALDISAPAANPNFLSIPPIFQQFKQLKEVSIRRSNIHQIGMHAFWGVPSIKRLDLSFNNISAVFDHNFRGLVNLLELNLDDNRIERLQAGAFKHLTELRILTMQRNLLEELVPRVFLKLAKLHVLKISENQFEELDPEVFKDIPDLRVLELRGCGIKRINTQLYHMLPYLSHLDLGNNQFQFLAEDEFRDLHRLHSLKLDGNLLPVILERTFVNQQQLKYLCLARNRLAKITDGAFVNLTSLVELDISFNRMKKLDNVPLTHLGETLQKLLMSGNGFSWSLIKPILQTLHRVWHLEIAQMKLRSVPEKFLPDRVRNLNVSWNNISSVSVQALPRHLQEIDLSYNELKGLNDSVIIKLETLKHVNLTGNPWSCSLCHITSILFRVNKTNLFQNLTCASPKTLKGQRLAALRLEDLTTCQSKDEEEDGSSSDSKLSLLIGLTCIAILAVFSIIFVVCSCVRRHSRNAARQQKRAAEEAENSLRSATAIFCKGEISFKFPLDLTERKMSVSTIDEIKRDSQQSLPNGTAGTGI